MEALANINDEIVPLTEARVPVLDRGFLFGDAVYEVLRIYQGKPWLLEEHFARLAYSLNALRIGGVDLGRLRQRLLATIAAGPFVEATAYIQITRGAGPRQHAFPKESTPFEILWVQEFRDSYGAARAQGAAVITHPDLRWERCDIKSTNLLGNVLARQAAAEAGCVEALLYLPDGTLTEGTHTSLFGVRDGAIVTTPTSHDILPGITRSLVLRLAQRIDVPVREETLRRGDLERIPELFLTGTTSEVLPIVQVDGRPIGDGLPGPVTRKLQAAFAQTVKEFRIAD